MEFPSHGQGCSKAARRGPSEDCAAPGPAYRHPGFLWARAAHGIPAGLAREGAEAGESLVASHPLAGREPPPSRWSTIRIPAAPHRPPRNSERGHPRPFVLAVNRRRDTSRRWSGRRVKSTYPPRTRSPPGPPGPRVVSFDFSRTPAFYYGVSAAPIPNIRRAFPSDGA